MIPLHFAIVAFVVSLTALHIGAHYSAHGVVNATQASLACFLVVNLMINLWEFVLHGQIEQIHREWDATRVTKKGREAEHAAAYFTSSVPWSKILSPRTWTGVWSSYALYDRGYADRRSYGWNIDVGNAWSTLIPAMIFAWGMTYDLMPARWLGALGIAVFWQMFYGTAVYFFQFFNNKNHVGHSRASILAVVVATNTPWFVFPLWGLRLSLRLIETNSYALFR